MKDKNKPADAGAVLKAIRESCSTFTTCLAGLKDVLDEPLKAQFAKAEETINLALAGLPEEMPTGGEVMQPLLAATSEAVQHFSDVAKAAKAEVATLRASIPEEIKKAIDAQIASGELMTKASHDKAITDATSAATTAATEAATTQVKLINQRRQILATASIPTPTDDSLLAGDEKDFEARKVSVAKRIEELKGFSKLPADRVLALAWNTDEEAYQSSLALMKASYESAAASVKSGVNPFVNRPAPANEPSRKPVIGVA